MTWSVIFSLPETKQDSQVRVKAFFVFFFWNPLIQGSEISFFPKKNHPAKKQETFQPLWGKPDFQFTHRFQTSKKIRKI